MQTSRFKDQSAYQAIMGYSRGARAGQYIAISGTTALGLTVPLDALDTHAQTKEALERAVAAVLELGGTRETILRSRLLLDPRADIEAAGRAHAEVLGDIAPANTTVFINGMVDPVLLVEVELDAVAAD